MLKWLMFYTFLGKRESVPSTPTLFLDPQIGRWHAVDNLSELNLSLSPYQYVSHNPINMIDPDGNNVSATQQPWQDIYQMLPLASTDELEGGFRYDNGEYTKDGAKVEFDEVLADMERNGDAETVYEADAENGGKEKKEEEKKENSSMQAALLISVALASDDVTGIGVINDLAIPFILGAAYLWNKYDGKTANPWGVTPAPVLTPRTEQPSNFNPNQKPDNRGPLPPPLGKGTAIGLGVLKFVELIYKNDKTVNLHSSEVKPIPSQDPGVEYFRKMSR